MRALRACIIGSTGVAVATFLCVYLGAAESQPPESKMPDLLQRVATLEEKVARLEKKLAEQPVAGYLVPAPPTTVVPPGTQPAPTVRQLPPGVPPNAVPREFNGQTYYIVPLSKEAARGVQHDKR